MKKFILVVLLVLVFALLPAIAEEQKTQPAAESPLRGDGDKKLHAPLCIA